MSLCMNYLLLMLRLLLSRYDVLHRLFTILVLVMMVFILEVDRTCSVGYLRDILIFLLSDSAQG